MALAPWWSGAGPLLLRERARPPAFLARNSTDRGPEHCDFYQEGLSTIGQITTGVAEDLCEECEESTLEFLLINGAWQP